MCLRPISNGMKVILTKDVAKLGNAGEIKNVADGYARNFLLRLKFAELATTSKIAEAEKRAESREKDRAKFKEKSDDELKKLAEEKIIFKRKANEKGHLYDGVGENEIISQLNQKGFNAITADWIELEKPIKEIGEFEVKIKTPSGEEGSLKIEVSPAK